MLHIGTVIAVFLIFQKEILHLFRSGRACLLVIVASVPTAVIGVLIEKWAEENFIHMRAVGIEFIITGILLYLTKHKNNPDHASTLFSDISIGKAFLIGIAQGIAVFPAISRSGITIAVALFLNIGRSSAGTFSFIISIPAIMGAFGYKLLTTSDISFEQFSHYFPGFVMSVIVGILSLQFLIKVVKKGEFYRFSFYCFVIGLITILLDLLQWKRFSLLTMNRLLPVH